MKYKAFEDWYKNADIKHLIVFEYNNDLVSPPFSTDICKDYSTLKILKKKDIHLDLPPSTSKTSACEVVNGDIWLFPYGIYDELNFVVQIKNGNPIYHELPFTGKGQYYSSASDGETAFSFPLGYENTNMCLYIHNDTVDSILLPYHGKKLHMGTVYCNGRYWSMPRGDDPGYNLLWSFDGSQFRSYIIDGVDNDISRKYSDLIVKENVMFSLPFGETRGLNKIVEFDTVSNTVKYHTILGHDFAKKYNGGVLVGDKIIAVPYGTESETDNSWGLVFDTVTKDYEFFDTELYFGGKYRYRSGVALNNHAFFFPSGTPSCPILKINTGGEIVKKMFMKEWLLGRPIVYKNSLLIIGYNIENHEHKLFFFDDNLTFFSEENIT